MKPTRSLAWLGAVAFLVSASTAFGFELARARYQQAQWRAEDRVLLYRDSLLLARRDVRVDSVVVARTVDRWRVVRDSLVDTLRVTDTVRVLIAAADTAVARCTDALGRCRETLALAARARTADSVALARLRGLVAVEQERTRRAESRRWRDRLTGAALGAAAGITLTLVR